MVTIAVENLQMGREGIKKSVKILPQSTSGTNGHLSTKASFITRVDGPNIHSYFNLSTTATSPRSI